MRRLAVVLAAFLLTRPVVAADLPGEAAYAKGDFITAARAWLPFAADGDADAQYALAILLLYGRGVERDVAAAAALLSPAAAAGHAEAAYALGLLYQDGEGVRRNYAEAARLYRIAADNGYRPAQNNLGLMYALGQGVPHDPLQAHVWFSVAAARGEPAAVKNRERVAAELSAAQLVESEHRAYDWTMAHKTQAALGRNPAALYPGVVEVLAHLNRVLPPAGQPAPARPAAQAPAAAPPAAAPAANGRPAPEPAPPPALPPPVVEVRPAMPVGPPVQLVPARP